MTLTTLEKIEEDMARIKPYMVNMNASHAVLNAYRAGRINSAEAAIKLLPLKKERDNLSSLDGLGFSDET